MMKYFKHKKHFFCDDYFEYTGIKKNYLYKLNNFNFFKKIINFIIRHFFLIKVDIYDFRIILEKYGYMVCTNNFIIQVLNHLKKKQIKEKKKKKKKIKFFQLIKKKKKKKI